MPTSRLFWKLVFACSGLNTAAAVIAALIFSFTLASDVADPAAAYRWIWGVATIESVCVFLLSYWLVGIAVRPIESLHAAADAIAAGDYAHRVYVPTSDELGKLAGAMNRMSQALGIRMSQLSQTADRQSTVLGGMIEGVIAVDARLRVVLANDAAGRLFGFRAAEIEGRALLEVLRSHELHGAVTSVLATGGPQRLETQRIGPQPSHINIHVQPLPGQPCPGVVLVIHDTTELRRLESIRRDFVANVSHELKTPLSSIKAYTETLRGGTVTDPEMHQKFLGRIEEQAERLHQLILDMLMLARIESDHQAFEIVSVDVADVVRSCLELQRRAAEAKHITLAIENDGAAGAAPSQVRADREGLREILDNLVDNAIKYTPEGGRVTVAWRRGASGEARDAMKDERGARHEETGASIQSQPLVPSSQLPAPNATLILSVTDSGIGIKPADLERVFERFYRVDKARSRELGSTGLGLSIVKHLAQAFGGKVGVDSTPGQGSTFTIELPSA